MAEKDLKTGTLYGVSVGPGDPELITLKALRCIQSCAVIAAPQTAEGNMLALDIVSGAVDLSDKIIVPLHFVMTREPAALRECHRVATEAVRPYLDNGMDVAVLNLGDVGIYATFDYLQAILAPEGYPVERIAGVPSFCAAAARLGQSLTGGMEQPLIIAPGRCAESCLPLQGTKVLMKSGRQLPEVLAALKESGRLEKSAMVCGCGLPDEEVYPTLSDYDPARTAGYFTTILVKE